MTKPTPHGQVPEALRLAEQYDHGDPAAHGNAWKAAVCTELRRLAELEAQIEALSGVQALSAAPAVPAGACGYFSFSDECGFDRHDTADAAKAAATEMLADIRRELGGEEWPMNVESICWGVVVERAAEHETTTGEDGEKYCDYVLKGASPTPPAEQQAAPKAAPAKVKLKGEAFGSARVGDIFYTALQQDEPVGEVVGGGDPRNSRAWPKVSGVSRDEGHSRALLVFFAAEPTDDEARAVHDTLAAAPTAQAAPDCHHRPPCDECAALAAQGGK